MNIENNIAKYLNIKNLKDTNFEYLHKLLKIQEFFSMEDIEAFYISNENMTTNIKNGEDETISINYGLVNNTEFMLRINHDFFLHLLIDYEESVLPNDSLEL